MDILQTIENVAASPDFITLATKLALAAASLISQSIAAREAGDEAKAQSIAVDAIKLMQAGVDADDAQLAAVYAKNDAAVHDKFDHEPPTNPIIKQP